MTSPIFPEAPTILQDGVCSGCNKRHARREGHKHMTVLNMIRQLMAFCPDTEVRVATTTKRTPKMREGYAVTNVTRMTRMGFHSRGGDQFDKHITIVTEKME